MNALLGLTWVRALRDNPAALEDWQKWLTEWREYQKTVLLGAATETEIHPRKLYYSQGKLDAADDITAFIQAALEQLVEQDRLEAQNNRALSS